MIFPIFKTFLESEEVWLIFLENGYEGLIKIGKRYRIPKKSFDEWIEDP